VANSGGVTDVMGKGGERWQYKKKEESKEKIDGDKGITGEGKRNKRRHHLKPSTHHMQPI
jgi:hypothetical protein